MIPLSRLRPFATDRERLSPNHGSRGGHGISLIVLHATAGSDEGAENWMVTSRGAPAVSAHLHIRRDGSSTRLVPDDRRAWHAGRSEWPGIEDVNSQSIGIEIGNRNDGQEPYTDAQYRTVSLIVRHYLVQGLPRAAVVSHAQIAPGRKTDPLGWDWGRMWAMVGLPPPEIPEPSGELAAVSPAPPVHTPPHLEPIEVPAAVPAEIQAQPLPFRAWQLRQWAVEVAENIGQEAYARRVPGAEALVDAALAKLRQLAAGVVPGWLLMLLWPAVEGAARRALAPR